MSEAYTLAEKAGVPLEIVRDFYAGQLFAHPALQHYARKLHSREFVPAGFVMSAGMKDVLLMLAAGQSNGVKLEIAEVARRKLQTAIEQGMGDMDWSAWHEVTRTDAGL